MSNCRFPAGVSLLTYLHQVLDMVRIEIHSPGSVYIVCYTIKLICWCPMNWLGFNSFWKWFGFNSFVCFRLSWISEACSMYHYMRFQFIASFLVDHLHFHYIQHIYDKPRNHYFLWEVLGLKLPIFHITVSATWLFIYSPLH